MQGESGRPGIPGMPGPKGHRVCINGNLLPVNSFYTNLSWFMALTKKTFGNIIGRAGNEDN